MARRNLFTNPGDVGLETALHQRLDAALRDPDNADTVYKQTGGRRGVKKAKRKLKLRRDELDE